MPQIALENRVCFKIIREIDRVENSRRFVLETDNGEKAMWCPKKLISVYRYARGTAKQWEVWMPEWLAEKAGLL